MQFSLLIAKCFNALIISIQSLFIYLGNLESSERGNRYSTMKLKEGDGESARLLYTTEMHSSCN